MIFYFQIKYKSSNGFFFTLISLLLDQENLDISPSLCVICDLFKYEYKIIHYVIYNILHILFKYLTTHYKFINNVCKGELYTTILNIRQITS